MTESLLYYFEETCRKYPQQVAVVSKGESINFKLLREVSLLIASNIKQHDCYRFKSPVFVYLPKSYKTIAAFLGVLYAGDFYTPSDTMFPFEKTQRILNVLSPSIYISDTANSKKLVENGIPFDRIINIDDLEKNRLKINPLESVSYTMGSSPIYVLFTSGTTGEPKGVEISNDSVLNFMKWIVNDFKLDTNTILGNQAEFYFDLSCFDIFAMIGAGATLNIIPKALFTFPQKLIQYICDNKINTISWVPSALINVANAKALEAEIEYSLTKILFCGEVLPVKYLNYWRNRIKNAIYVNMYGPTEATCACAYYTIDRDFKESEVMPIGNPCINTELCILDNDTMKICESGVGELCIAGLQLANGYYQNESKTEQSFFTYTFEDGTAKRLYRTGDLVSYNENNEIIYVGRKDTQIKYKGYRIELGEIESACYTCNEVKRACVIFNQFISLYYEGSIEENDMKIFLKGRIPKYMLPQKIKKMKTLPLNQNGKIDRKQLLSEENKNGLCE